MEFKIEDHTIFITIHGSHAYGMARPESDVDIKGIAIPPKIYFHGFSKRFDQFEGQFPRHRDGFLYNIERVVKRVVPPDEHIDSTIYDIRKFMKLASDCNPNIIEVLFTDENLHVVTSDLFKKLIENRDLFLSTKAKFRFCGYAFSQLKRIKTHRAWLLNPPLKKPAREDFGLPDHGLISRDHREAAEGLIKKQVQKWILLEEEMPRETLESVRQSTINTMTEMWESLIDLAKDFEELDHVPLPVREEEFDVHLLSNAAGKKLGYDTNFLALLDAERKYKGALKYYNQYQEWKKNRNPARAKMEAEFGYDGKHASHLVRLLRMAEEILTKGEVIVCRPDAEELLAIRKGSWKFDDLIQWAENQQHKLNKFYESGASPLPKVPNYNKIDELCEELVEESFK